MIEDIYLDDFYKGFCLKLVKDKVKAEELHSEFIILVIEFDKNKLKQLIENNEFKYYAVSIIRNLAFNKYSIYNKNNNNLFNEEISDNIEEEKEEAEYLEEKETSNLLACVKRKLQYDADKSTNEWYQSNVFLLYHTKFKSYRKMSQETKIPVASLYNSVQATTEKIKNLYEDRYNKLINDNRVY